MASTILLDVGTWDLTLDVRGNIALSEEPDALAQDAASAIRTFQGECFWDTSVGLPYMTQVLAKRPSLALLKQLIVDQAETVPGIASAKCFVTAVDSRSVQGQVQVTSGSGEVAAANFSVINPQTGA